MLNKNIIPQKAICYMSTIWWVYEPKLKHPYTNVRFRGKTCLKNEVSSFVSLVSKLNNR